MSGDGRGTTGPRRLRRLALLVPLAAASCVGLDSNGQGPLQPQAVSGPCRVKKFFILGLTSVRTEMAVGNVGQACSFTVFDPNLQLVLSAALVTAPPAHGRATAMLANFGRQAMVSYTPQPGYAGPDQFSVTFEPSAFGVTLAVTVQPAPPAP